MRPPNQIFIYCDNDCSSKHRFLKKIKSLEDQIGENLYGWLVTKYEREKRSFRQIGKELKINPQRTVPRLLRFFDITIRQGSEAIASQWFENEKRKKQAAKNLTMTTRPKIDYWRGENIGKAEKIAMTWLAALKIKYISQKQIINFKEKNPPFLIDLFLPEFKTGI